jgi:ribosomal protein S18 acetylase RimI-like enzyme
MQKNLTRMLEMVHSFFDMKNDPDQLQVSEAAQARLQRIHPMCMTEVTNEDGPILWLLVFPTSQALVDSFLKDEINEQELFDRTPEDSKGHDCIYLCSASVLPEFRNKGLASQHTIAAVQAMQKEFPIKALCVWPFSKEGEQLGQYIANKLNLPLYVKPF